MGFQIPHRSGIFRVGSPPKDEMKLLRKELLLLQSQLLFERHKCELHATRNRRLVGKVFKANAVREELAAVVNILPVLCKIRHRHRLLVSTVYTVVFYGCKFAFHVIY